MSDINRNHGHFREKTEQQTENRRSYFTRFDYFVIFVSAAWVLFGWICQYIDYWTLL